MHLDLQRKLQSCFWVSGFLCLIVGFYVNILLMFKNMNKYEILVHRYLYLKMIKHSIITILEWRTPTKNEIQLLRPFCLVFFLSSWWCCWPADRYAITCLLLRALCCIRWCVRFSLAWIRIWISVSVWWCNVYLWNHHFSHLLTSTPIPTITIRF